MYHSLFSEQTESTLTQCELDNVSILEWFNGRPVCWTDPWLFQVGVLSVLYLSKGEGTSLIASTCHSFDKLLIEGLQGLVRQPDQRISSRMV